MARSPEQKPGVEIHEVATNTDINLDVLRRVAPGKTIRKLTRFDRWGGHQTQRDVVIQPRPKRTP